MSIKMMMVMTTRMTVRVELIRRLLSREISHCTASHRQLVKPAGLGLSLAGRSSDTDHCFAGPLCQNPDFFFFFSHLKAHLNKEYWDQELPLNLHVSHLI